MSFSALSIRSSTDHCAYSQLQGDRIIVNRKFFATRLVMRDGPIVFARDFDRKRVRQKRNLLATCVKIYDYAHAKTSQRKFAVRKVTRRTIASTINPQ